MPYSGDFMHIEMVHDGTDEWTVKIFVIVI